MDVEEVRSIARAANFSGWLDRKVTNHISVFTEGEGKVMMRGFLRLFRCSNTMCIGAHHTASILRHKGKGVAKNSRPGSAGSWENKYRCLLVFIMIITLNVYILRQIHTRTSYIYIYTITQ